MRLIHFYGVNCHLLSLINIASRLDKGYPSLFSGLWSEASFSHNKKHQIHISKKIFESFSANGIMVNKAPFELIPCKDFFLVGMDTFFIPWSPVYHSFNGTHYFMAKKENSDTIICFDPIYNKKNIRIGYKEIIPHAFDICSVTKISKKAPAYSLTSEAKRVMKNLPFLQSKLCASIENCKNISQLEAIVRQIIAMISNRFMFRCYLKSIQSPFSRFFNKTFFNKWLAVKNGLFKASMQKTGSTAQNAACLLLKDLLNKEISIANKILLSSKTAILA